MMLVTAVRTLKDFERDADTVMQVTSHMLRAVGDSEEARQEAFDAGAIQSLSHAMNFLKCNGTVIERATILLGSICFGVHEAGLARKQLAFESGAIYSLIAGMEEHPDASALQEYAIVTLGNITTNNDDYGLTRKQAATEAGVFQAIVKAMKTHAGASKVLAAGCYAIANLCRINDDRPKEAVAAQRRQLAVDHGAATSIIQAIRTFPEEALIQERGRQALANIAFKHVLLKEAVIEAGAAPEWLENKSDPLAEIAIVPQSA